MSEHRSSIPPNPEEKTSKAAWRKAFGKELSALSNDDMTTQSNEAAKMLQKLPEYRNAQRISVFLSMPGGELQTNAIVSHALESGKHVFVPYLSRSPSMMHMLQLRDVEDYRSLKPDKWGIPSIESASVSDRINCFGYPGLATDGDAGCESGLDIILMPAVAFDSNFDRLGHGKGYYDRFLTSYFEKKKRDGSSFQRPYLIGLALQEQILAPPHTLPVESWDHKVDAIVAGNQFRTRVSP